MLELASSRLKVLKLVLNNPQPVLEWVNEILDSDDREHLCNDGQSEQCEESKEENEFSQHGDDTDNHA